MRYLMDSGHFKLTNYNILLTLIEYMTFKKFYLTIGHIRVENIIAFYESAEIPRYNLSTLSLDIWLVVYHLKVSFYTFQDCLGHSVY